MVVHPQRAQEENGEEWMRENFVGTGPFQVDEWIRDNRAVFTKSGHHWEFDPAPVSGLITGKLGRLSSSQLPAWVFALITGVPWVFYPLPGREARWTTSATTPVA